MALLTALGVYPLLLVLSVVLNPVVGGLPLALRLGASLVVGIPLMTWLIMPGLSRLFFDWLYPEPQRGALQQRQS
jgi:antibiotic biosynthesis monooxygenase (ABM) superfamily enzyme